MPPGLETMMANQNKNNDTDALKQEVADLKKQIADDKMNAQIEKMNEKMDALANENFALKSQLAQATGQPVTDIGTRGMPGQTSVGTAVPLNSAYTAASSQVGSATNVGGSHAFGSNGVKV